MHILLVESNPADAFLMQDAFKEAGHAEKLTVFEDSALALEHLRGPESRHNLILLDLHVAPLSGFEFLTQLRSDSRRSWLPVIVMTGSENARDIQEAYRRGANCYIIKPGKLNDYLRCVKVCFEFWSSVATLPPEHSA